MYMHSWWLYNRGGGYFCAWDWAWEDPEDEGCEGGAMMSPISVLSAWAQSSSSPRFQRWTISLSYRPSLGRRAFLDCACQLFRTWRSCRRPSRSFNPFEGARCWVAETK